jgi:hypothetical protein
VVVVIMDVEVVGVAVVVVSSPPVVHVELDGQSVVALTILE